MTTAKKLTVEQLKETIKAIVKENLTESDWMQKAVHPSKKGEFTAKAKEHGMEVQAFAKHVLANTEDFPEETVNQAKFAKAAGSVAKKESRTLTVSELKKIISEEIARAIAEQVAQPARASSMMSSLIKKLGPDQFAVEFIRAFGSDDQIRPVLSRLVKDMNLDEQTATGNGLTSPVAPSAPSSKNLLGEEPEEVHTSGFRKPKTFKVEKFPELEVIVNEALKKTVILINERTALVKSKNPYKAQWVLEELIKKLEQLV